MKRSGTFVQCWRSSHRSGVGVWQWWDRIGRHLRALEHAAPASVWADDQWNEDFVVTEEGADDLLRVT
jgi:hypothetical protein